MINWQSICVYAKSSTSVCKFVSYHKKQVVIYIKKALDDVGLFTLERTNIV